MTTTKMMLLGSLMVQRLHDGQEPTRVINAMLRAGHTIDELYRTIHYLSL